MRQATRQFRRLINFLTPAHLCGRTLSRSGSLTPYGGPGELRALPWEGLQLQETTSVAP